MLVFFPIFLDRLHNVDIMSNGKYSCVKAVANLNTQRYLMRPRRGRCEYAFPSGKILIEQTNSSAHGYSLNVVYGRDRKKLFLEFNQQSSEKCHADTTRRLY